MRKLLEKLLEMFGQSLEFYSVWTKPDDYWEQFTSKTKAKKEFDSLVKSGKFEEVHFERWAGQKLEDGTLDGDYMADVEIYRSAFEAYSPGVEAEGLKDGKASQVRIDNKHRGAGDRL